MNRSVQRILHTRNPPSDKYFAPGGIVCATECVQYCGPMSTLKLSDKLKRIVNLRAFAEKCGVSRRTLYHVIEGKHPTRPATVEKILAALAEHQPEMRRGSK
jgi:hypothetical protein